MYFKKTILSLSMLFAFFSYVPALEIPISGVLERDGSTAKNIAFVDMERVFESHPMTERYKNELKNFAKTRKNVIDTMINDYKKLENQLATISSELNQAQSNNDQQALADLAVQFDNIKKAMEGQRESIADMSRRTKNELSVMEDQNSLKVLHDIDIVIKDISKKKDVEIILDKQSVLCGSESCEDITNEVIKRIKGR